VRDCVPSAGHAPACRIITRPGRAAHFAQLRRPAVSPADRKHYRCACPCSQISSHRLVPRNFSARRRRGPAARNQL